MGIQITTMAEAILVLKKQLILALTLWEIHHQVSVLPYEEMARCSHRRLETMGIRMMVSVVRVTVQERSLVILVRQDQIVLLLYEILFVVMVY